VTRDAQTEGTSGPGWVYTLTNLAKDEALHRMQVLAELGIFPNLVTKCRSVLSQKYSGDITILPEIQFKDFPRMLKNPTSEFMVQACLAGERATWPKLSRIRNHCAVELELDAAVQILRARVVFSPSQVDLRRMTTGTFQPIIRKVGGKRTDSGSLTLKDSNGEEEEVAPSRKTSSRPSLRTAQSHFGFTKRYLPLGRATAPHSTLITPMATPRVGLENHGFNFMPDKPAFNLNIQIPDFSSASETTQPSSDADVDSHTDESSPDPEFRGLGLYDSQTSGREIDFFSSNQPITPNTDRILATSPGIKPNMGLTYTPSVNSTSGRNNIEVRKSTTAPSSPEARYKRLFHHWKGETTTK